MTSPICTIDLRLLPYKHCRSSPFSEHIKLMDGKFSGPERVHLWKSLSKIVSCLSLAKAREMLCIEVLGHTFGRRSYHVIRQVQHFLIDRIGWISYGTAVNFKRLIVMQQTLMKAFIEWWEISYLTRYQELTSICCLMKKFSLLGSIAYYRKNRVLWLSFLIETYNFADLDHRCTLVRDHSLSVYFS